MHMRTLLCSALLVPTALLAQVNMTLLGDLDYQSARNSELSNIWGYTDELANEYALIGVNGDPNVNNTGGLAVVDVTDPSAPTELAFFPGANSNWREIKTYGDYAYVTTEASAGLFIVDLSPLPQSAVLPSNVFIGAGWISSHSLFIDEPAGRLYIHGSNRGNGGVIIYDLTQDPMNPVEIGEYDPYYCHDSYARGDTLYAAHIYDGFVSIVNVSDPQNPVLLGSQSTPSTFSHNVWLDDTGDHMFTTDEVANAFVGSYDISDLGNIQEVDRLRSAVDQGGAIPHNTYWLNDFLVTSYYTYGCAVYDASRPENLVEVGNYDTSPFVGNGFNGAWGVYPFLPSGNLLISDIEGGLKVLGVTYASACWLEGTVTDQNTSTPINAVQMTINGTGISDVTDLAGLYKSGYHTAGTYDISFAAAGYADLTITGVQLTSGSVTIQDAQLVPLPTFAYSGLVADAVTLQGIPNAKVRLRSDFYEYNTTCDAAGNFTIPAMYEDTYDVSAAAWGWHYGCIEAITITSGSAPLLIDLTAGYADDFGLDLGWTTGGNATEGLWTMDEPVGQEFSGFFLQTDVDIDDDCGDECYLTGNGADIGLDDVQDGETLLISPVFDATALSEPLINWHYWYFNAALGGSVDDSLSFFIRTAGTDHWISSIHPNANMTLWVEDSVVISSIIPPAADMQFVVRAHKPFDIGDHLLECAFDGFEVKEDTPDGMVEVSLGETLRFWPNPTNGQLTVIGTYSGNAKLTVFDATGRSVQEMALNGKDPQVTLAAASGAYTVRVVSGYGSQRTGRVVIH